MPLISIGNSPLTDVYKRQDRKVEAKGMIDYSIDELDNRVIIYVGKGENLKNICLLYTSWHRRSVFKQKPWMRVSIRM